MYNGIGLPTARGSGTSGYVQKNLSHRSKRKDTHQVLPIDEKLDKPINKDILLHYRKRKIESECFAYNLKLQESGWSEKEIEKEIQEFRAKKLEELNNSTK